MNAYAAASFFAVDRYASYKQDWGTFYEAGGLLIADRYTTSNAVHQTVKLPAAEREKFLNWLFDFEFHLLGLPEPTRVLYLDLPTELSGQMMRKREESTTPRRTFTKKDAAYLRLAVKMPRFVAERCGWTRIDLQAKTAVRSMEDIHEEVCWTSCQTCFRYERKKRDAARPLRPPYVSKCSMHHRCRNHCRRCDYRRSSK